MRLRDVLPFMIKSKAIGVLSFGTIAILTIIPPIASAPEAAWTELSRTENGLVGFFGLCVFYVLSYGLPFVGFRLLNQKSMMEETPTTSVQAAPMGRVELKGEVQPVDDPIKDPLENKPNVFCDITVKKRVNTGRNSRLRKVYSNQRRVDYALDDGTGQALISDTNPDRRLEMITERYRSADELPESIRAVLDERDVELDVRMSIKFMQKILGIFSTTGPTNFMVQLERIEVGEDLYVLGEAQTGNDSALRITRDDSTDTFIVSNKGEAALQSRYRWWGWAIIAGSVVGIPLLYLMILASMHAI